VYDVTGSGVPMRARCTMPRHAIDDAHNSLLVPIIGPETVNLGCHRGRLGCVRSLTRSSPDNTGDRSDPIRSLTMTNACLPAPCHRRPQTTGALRQVLIFPDVGSSTPSGCRIEISSSVFRVRWDTQSTSAKEDTYDLPPPSARWSSLCPLRNNISSQNVHAAAWVHIRSAIVNFIKLVR